MNKQLDAIVIGAGLTGLTTAFYLNKQGKNILVVDKAESVGGVIQTKEKNGFVYEAGPNTGILGSPEIAELFEDLNGSCQLEIGNEKVKKRYILHKAQWEQLPSGLVKGVKTPLFSLKDKFRILGEPFRKPGTNPDETLAELVKRRMGQSFLNYAIDPFILGVYAGDPSYLVPKYALPKLYNLEQDYGSFIGGAIKKKFKSVDERTKKATREIFSFKNGLSSLTKAIYETVGKDRFLLGADSIQIQKEGENYILNCTVNNESLSFSTPNIITTVPAFELNKMLPFVEEKLVSEASNVFYAPVVEAAIGFKNWQGIDLDGFGGLIPHIEKRNVLGVMYMSSLFKDRAPENGALMSVFIGGARRQELTTMSKSELENLVAQEMKQLMGLKDFNPDLFELTWHKKAIPQYGKESKERFEAVEKIRNQHKGLYIGGNLCDGIGMADRVKQGRKLALEIK